MTSKEALKCIIYRLTAQEDDLELRETAKVEIENIKKDLDRLEKLEDKTTPKKVSYLNYGGYKIGNHHCPTCDNIINKQCNYCPNCGQRLDWEVKNEKEN